MSNDIFKTVLGNLNRLGMNVKPQKIQSQVTPTTRWVPPWPVRLEVCLLKAMPKPTEYTQRGAVAKRQPKPYEAGENVWLEVNPGNGKLRLYPFYQAGMGWEISHDAQEGVEFEFI